MADIRYVSYSDMLSIAAEMKSKYTNQNALSQLVVGEGSFSAAEATDSFEIAAGSNVSLALSGDTLTISATDTTYSNVTADSTGAAASGLMTSADKYKLNNIAAGAEVNQNAFSNVKVGSTTVAADTKTDTLELVAGTNVTLTGDASNDKVTIAAADTTYTLEQDSTDGHKITFTPSTGSPVEITIPDDDTTYGAAVASTSGEGGTDGLITAASQEKLNGIATGAQVNVIETVKVNGSALTPSSKAVNITIAAGTTGVGTFKVNGTDVTAYGLGTAAGAAVETTGVASNTTTLATTAQVKSYVDSTVSSAYKAAGSLAPSGVASSLLVAANEGKVYNLSGTLTLNSTSAALFVDGTSGESFPEGTNIVVVSASGGYKFDVLAGFVDLSSYAKTADFGGLSSEELAAVKAAL